MSSFQALFVLCHRDFKDLLVFLCMCFLFPFAYMLRPFYFQGSSIATHYSCTKTYFHVRGIYTVSIAVYEDLYYITVQHILLLYSDYIFLFLNILFAFRRNGSIFRFGFGQEYQIFLSHVLTFSKQSTFCNSF